MDRSRPLVSLAGALVLSCVSIGPTAAIEGLDTPASDLRIGLDRLLAEHTFLTVQALQAGVTDDAQFAAAAEALEANTSELQSAVAGIYDEAAGRRFGDLWRAHIGYVVDYVRAHQDGDAAAEQEAVEGLEAYQADFASFLAGANPHLSEETLHHLLENHVAQLQQVASLQAGDYERVYALTREAYGHMFVLGDGLSRAIAQQFPDRFPGRAIAFGPAFDLQIALERLLGEHAFFAVEVIRLARADPEHQRAASEALASNGDALQAAITDIYGANAGHEFAAIWEDHNGYYVDYVRAALAGDETAAEDARTELERFGARAAAFFASANDALDADAVRSALAAHAQHLLEQVDAHVAGDYGRSFAIGRDAHHHMAAISNVLATGIAHQFPNRFLPDTALRPASQKVSSIFSSMGLLALSAAAAIAVARALTPPGGAARSRSVPARGSRSSPSRSAGTAKAR